MVFAVNAPNKYEYFCFYSVNHAINHDLRLGGLFFVCRWRSYLYRRVGSDAGIHNIKKSFGNKKVITALDTIGIGTRDKEGNIALVKSF